MDTHITAQATGRNLGNGHFMHNNAIRNMGSISVHGCSASKMSVADTNAKFEELKREQAKGKK